MLDAARISRDMTRTMGAASRNDATLLWVAFPRSQRTTSDAKTNPVVLSEAEVMSFELAGHCCS